MAHAGSGSASGSARFGFSANEASFGGSLKFRDVVRETFRGHAQGLVFPSEQGSRQARRDRVVPE